MPLRQVSNAPMRFGTTLDPPGLNPLFASIINPFNSHNHDPGDPNGNFAESIPAWGPANALYAQHGPGGTAAGNDWNVTFNGAAAIPADPSLTVLDPHTAITAAHGIHAEVAMLRGAMAQLTNGNWNDDVNLAALDASGNLTLGVGNILSAGTLISTITTGSPFHVASSVKVDNLNADTVDGLSAVPSTVGGVGGPTFAGLMVALNPNGFLGTGFLEADFAEAATMDALTVGTSTLVNSLNRLRAVLAGWAAAFGSGDWRVPPTGLVTQVIPGSGAPLAGPVAIIGGVGCAVSPDNGRVRIDVTGTVAPSAGALYYGDLFPNAVIYGLTVSAGAGLQVNIAPGAAYIPGRATLGSITAVPVPASTSWYVDWMGGQGAAAFSINSNGAPAGNYVRLASGSTNANGVVTITDLRKVISRYLDFPGGGTAPTVNDISDGIKGNLFDGTILFGGAPRAFTWASGGAKVAIAPAAALTLTINRNGSSVATMVIPAGALASGPLSASPAFATGDAIEVVVSGSAGARDLTYYLQSL